MTRNEIINRLIDLNTAVTGIGARNSCHINSMGYSEVRELIWAAIDELTPKPIDLDRDFTKDQTDDWNERPVWYVKNGYLLCDTLSKVDMQELLEKCDACWSQCPTLGQILEAGWEE